MPTPPAIDRVSAGPFEHEPVGLGRLLSENFSDAVSGEEIRRRYVGWLTDRLVSAGVELGAADGEMVEVLAEEGWSVVQVVAGWVSRAAWDPGGRADAGADLTG